MTASSECLNKPVMSAERRALEIAVTALSAVASGGHMLNVHYATMAQQALAKIKGLVPNAGEEQ